MPIRHVARAVLASAAAVASAGAFSALALSGPASAAPCTGVTASGCEVPGATQPQAGFTPGTPFDSGQQINIVIPANSILHPNANVHVVECAFVGGALPPNSGSCDGNTIEGIPGTVQSNGSVTITNYPIYALPDSISLGESSSQGAVCDLGHQCVLYIGENQNDFTAAHFFSTPFVVHPNGDDLGSSPGDGTPEFPLAIGLPIAALGIVGGTVLVRRRRSAANAA